MRLRPFSSFQISCLSPFPLWKKKKKKTTSQIKHIPISILTQLCHVLWALYGTFPHRNQHPDPIIALKKLIMHWISAWLSVGGEWQHADFQMRRLRHRWLDDTLPVTKAFCGITQAFGIIFLPFQWNIKVSEANHLWTSIHFCIVTLI